MTLARSTNSGVCGGVPAAIQYYVNETTPNLLIIESAGDPRQLLSELDQLAEYCDENIRVLVLGQTNDIRLYRELMRRGVSEYLVAPVDPVQLIRSIASLFADPEAPFTGKTVAIIGGGPAGLACAHELRRFGHSPTIFEKRSVLGGLNTTGIAPYKLRADASIAEVDYVLGIGGTGGIAAGATSSRPSALPQPQMSPRRVPPATGTSGQAFVPTPQGQVPPHPSAT